MKTSDEKPRSSALDIFPREPRCRICRDEELRVVVNRLLEWRGVPLQSGRRRLHVVTYADILRGLKPLNDGRAASDQITYDSLVNHAKRHYEIEGIARYWNSRLVRDLRRAMTGGDVKACREMKTDG